jgi:ABC-type Fe3+/spermidine/putrescine transport system ATPase subunit
MLELKNVSFSVSNRFALQQINFSLAQGKHLAVIGESGCGKTTLLKLIYGLYDCDTGAISWNNTTVTGPKDNLLPGMPFMKYLSQDFDLMPFISVTENIQKYLSRLYPKESAARTQELLEVVEMTAFAKAHVKTLSGGQKQRVALAQTLAKAPEVILLDEPFSHIDNFRKNNLRRKLFAYLKQENITCLVATHDPTDVLSYMDETLVLRDGKTLDHRQTLDLYNNPRTQYIASLFGEVNEVSKSWFDKSAQEGETVLMYPHQLVISEENGIEVTVVRSYFKGEYYLIEGLFKSQKLFFQSSRLYNPESLVLVQLKV